MKLAAALIATMILKVAHPDATRAQILDLALQHHGHPQLVTDQRVIVKVPPAELNALCEALGKQGLVLDRSMTRTELGPAIAQLEASLRSKQDTFLKLQGFLVDTDVAATLSIEQQLIALVAEIEQAKGQLRVEQARADWAIADVSFQLQERAAPRAVADSPFPWLNSVELKRFLGEF